MTSHVDLSGLSSGSVALLGIPWDENSSFLRGAAKAPPRIREALCSGASNLCAENLRDLGTEPRFHDVGDLTLAGGSGSLGQIEEVVRAVLDRGARLLALGGDHAVTYPIIKAYSAAFDGLEILHLDAHPDLYDSFDGNRYSHACPFARIMEEGRVARLVQVGVRAMNPHQQEQAERFGVELIAMRDWETVEAPAFHGPLYLSLDMDVLDPAFAPGVSHHEPGGLATRDVITLIQRLRFPLVGADIVELNPDRDPVGITAMAAAKLLKEMAARMLERP
jgi:arginase